MDSKALRVVTINLYVARNFKENPCRALACIIKNREYFPSLLDEDIEKMKKEINFSNDILYTEQIPTFAGINVERKNFEKQQDSLKNKNIKQAGLKSNIRKNV